MITLSEYYDMLDKHDWFFDMSDDHSVWEAGRRARNKLKDIAWQSPAHKELYYRFTLYVGKVDAPKPMRPIATPLDIAIAALKDIAGSDEPTTYDDAICVAYEFISLAREALRNIEEVG